MITVAAMIATYGSFSALTLAVPRLMFALAEHGQFPRYFGVAHPRFKTPHRAIVAFALLAILIGATGTFRWALLIATGSTVFVYGGVCAALPRLRHLHPDANAVRLPFGYGFAAVGILMSLAVLSGLHLQELLVLGGTLIIATLSWLWLRRDLGGSARSLGVGQ
jgi:amino acid transporter